MKRVWAVCAVLAMVSAAQATTTVTDCESGVFARGSIGSPNYWWYSIPATSGETASVMWQYGSGYDYRAYFRFELPTDVGSMPTSATLKLTEIAPYYIGYPVHVLYSDTQESITAYPDGVNAAMHPGYRPETVAYDYALVPDWYTMYSQPTTLTVDVTDAIKSAYAAGQKYAWFTVYSTVHAENEGRSSWQSTWGTHLNANESYRPALTVVPEPMTMALLAMGGVAMLRRRIAA